MELEFKELPHLISQAYKELFSHIELRPMVKIDKGINLFSRAQYKKSMFGNFISKYLKINRDKTGYVRFSRSEKEGILQNITIKNSHNYRTNFKGTSSFRLVGNKINFFVNKELYLHQKTISFPAKIIVKQKGKKLQIVSAYGMSQETLKDEARNFMVNKLEVFGKNRKGKLSFSYRGQMNLNDKEYPVTLLIGREKKLEHDIIYKVDQHLSLHQLGIDSPDNLFSKIKLDEVLFFKNKIIAKKKISSHVTKFHILQNLEKKNVLLVEIKKFDFSQALFGKKDILKGLHFKSALGIFLTGNKTGRLSLEKVPKYLSKKLKEHRLKARNEIELNPETPFFIAAVDMKRSHKSHLLNRLKVNRHIQFKGTIDHETLYELVTENGNRKFKHTNFDFKAPLSNIKFPKMPLHAKFIHPELRIKSEKKGEHSEIQLYLTSMLKLDIHGEPLMFEGQSHLHKSLMKNGKKGDFLDIDFFGKMRGQKWSAANGINGINLSKLKISFRGELQKNKKRNQVDKIELKGEINNRDFKETPVLLTFRFNKKYKIIGSRIKILSPINLGQSIFFSHITSSKFIDLESLNIDIMRRKGKKRNLTYSGKLTGANIFNDGIKFSSGFFQAKELPKFRYKMSLKGEVIIGSKKQPFSAFLDTSKKSSRHNHYNVYLNKSYLSNLGSFIEIKDSSLRDIQIGRIRFKDKRLRASLLEKGKISKKRKMEVVMSKKKQAVLLFRFSNSSNLTKPFSKRNYSVKASKAIFLFPMNFIKKDSMDIYFDGKREIKLKKAGLFLAKVPSSNFKMGKKLFSLKKNIYLEGKINDSYLLSLVQGRVIENSEIESSYLLRKIQLSKVKNRLTFSEGKILLSSNEKNLFSINGDIDLHFKNENHHANAFLDIRKKGKWNIKGIFHSGLEAPMDERWFHLHSLSISLNSKNKKPLIKGILGLTRGRQIPATVTLKGKKLNKMEVKLSSNLPYPISLVREFRYLPHHKEINLRGSKFIIDYSKNTFNISSKFEGKNFSPFKNTQISSGYLYAQKRKGNWSLSFKKIRGMFFGQKTNFSIDPLVLKGTDRRTTYSIRLKGQEFKVGKIIKNNRITSINKEKISNIRLRNKVLEGRISISGKKRMIQIFQMKHSERIYGNILMKKSLVDRIIPKNLRIKVVGSSKRKKKSPLFSFNGTRPEAFMAKSFPVEIQRKLK